VTLLPPPNAYNLPGRYDSWRPNQAEAVDAVCSSPRIASAIVAPTGFGKTITGAVIGRFFGTRWCYQVATNNLLSQIERDMPGVFFEITGKRNYNCRALLEHGFVGSQARADRAEGMCQGCQYRDAGCDYYDAVRRATFEESVLTNYSFWLASNLHADGIGKFGVLILDEAHAAVDQITGAMRVELSARELERHLREDLPKRMPNSDWVEWARPRLSRAMQRAEALRLSHGQGSRELGEATRLVARLTAIASLNDNWVEDRDWKEPDAGTAFEPIWPAPYRGLIFREGQKSVLMSATIRPKTLELLGLAPDEFDFFEYPSSFPVARRPVIFLPCVVQRHGMTIEQKMQAVRKCDQIIAQRLDRKGTIHTVSFDRAELLLEYSKYARHMILTGRGSKAIESVKRFKAAGPGAILVGPNFDTGIDLPYDECEYQIILKVPFGDKRAPVVKARCEQDPDYDNYQAMGKIVQMAGRAMRAADDQCETFIIDDQWGNWFLRKNNQFAPRYFLEACRREQYIPQPPPSLERRRG
jgi:ATP-dependent DNA helicase DinG